MNVVRRARPWLGTMVEIRVEGLSDRCALDALENAFAEVATIHRLMSFHDADSDLSQLHRAYDAVRVDPRTYDVISCALTVARLSDGVFDPTVAAIQVENGTLPRPTARAVDAKATWHDIELLGDHHIRLRRSLWIDLGGIAKGYAVDRALHILVDAGATQACVNAGGDMRVHGDRAELIHVRTPTGTEPLLELTNASMATSTVAGCSHVDGVTRETVRETRTVSVIARDCMITDALTKVVLAGNAGVVSNVLAAFDARACVHDVSDGWRILDRAA